MAGFFRRAFDFVSHPSNSRTMGLVAVFFLLTAVSLTVYVAQQQQSLQQKAFETNPTCNPPYSGWISEADSYIPLCPACAPDQSPSGNICSECKATQPSSYRDRCTKINYIFKTFDKIRGEFCYKETNVGKSCSNTNGQQGICDDATACVILPTAIPSPTAVPTAIPAVVQNVCEGTPQNVNNATTGIACKTTSDLVGQCDGRGTCITLGTTPIPSPTLCQGTISGYKLSCKSICDPTEINLTSQSPANAPVCNDKTTVCCGFTAPTPTAVPTATPNPANTSLSFTVGLPDLTTKAPGQVLKNLYVEVTDPTTNSKVSESVVGITYDSQTKKFSGSNSINWVPASGIYNIKVRAPGYLKILIPSKTITRGQENIIPVDIVTPGDVNGDNLIDIQDYNALVGCFGNKFRLIACNGTTNADLNDDGASDGIDYNIFIKVFTLGKRVGD